MQIRVLIWIGFLVLLLVDRTVDAQSIKPPPAPKSNPSSKNIHSERRLSLRQLEELALANNPTIQQALADVEKARGIHVQSGLYPNPIGGYQAAEIGNNGKSGQQGIFLGQEFVTANKLSLNRQIANQEIQAASWQWEAQEQRVRTAVRLRFYELLASQRTIELAKELLEIAEASKKASQELFDAGEGNKSQILQAKVEVRRSTISLRNSENHLQATWRRLAAIIGDEFLQPAEIDGSLDRAPPTLKWEETWSWLKSESPQLQSAGSRIERAKWAIQRACVEPIPNLNTQIGIQYDDSTNYTVIGLQAGVAFPIFNRNQGNIRATHAELIRATYEQRRIELSLRERLSTTFRNYQNAYMQMVEYQNEILPLARENLKLTAESFNQGQLPYIQLLTAQRTYFDTSLAYVNALKTLWQSVVTIQGLILTEGLAAPGSSDDTIPTFENNTTYPMGLFPMMQP